MPVFYQEFADTAMKLRRKTTRENLSVVECDSRSVRPTDGYVRSPVFLVVVEPQRMPCYFRPPRHLLAPLTLGARTVARRYDSDVCTDSAGRREGQAEDVCTETASRERRWQTRPYRSKRFRCAVAPSCGTGRPAGSRRRGHSLKPGAGRESGA